MLNKNCKYFFLDKTNINAENYSSVLKYIDTNCTATCLLSRKLFKLDEPDMQDTAGEAGTNS